MGDGEEELRLHLDDDTYIIKNVEMLGQALNTEEGRSIVQYIEITIELDTVLRDLIFQDLLKEIKSSKEDAISHLTERIDDNKKVLEELRK